MADRLAEPRSAPRAPGQRLTFLNESEYRLAARDGVSGFHVTVRLVCYRSLPLSCVMEMHLSIDGSPVDESGLRLVLGGTAFSLDELAERKDVEWYVLDTAELFVPTLLSPGAHELEGTLTLLLPFATGGRRTLTVHSRLTLDVPSEVLA